MIQTYECSFRKLQTKEYLGILDVTKVHLPCHFNLDVLKGTLRINL